VPGCCLGVSAFTCTSHAAHMHAKLLSQWAGQPSRYEGLQANNSYSASTNMYVCRLMHHCYTQGSTASCHGYPYGHKSPKPIPANTCSRPQHPNEANIQDKHMYTACQCFKATALIYAPDLATHAHNPHQQPQGIHSLVANIVANLSYACHGLQAPAHSRFLIIKQVKGSHSLPAPLSLLLLHLLLLPPAMKVHGCVLR
jgi:hypothetical protein